MFAYTYPTIITFSHDSTFSMNAVLACSPILFLCLGYVEGYLSRSLTRPPPTCDMTRADVFESLKSPNGRSGRSYGKSKKTFVQVVPTCPLPRPIDCKWSMWSTWTACSITCGGITGTSSRTRDKKGPCCGGMDCQGIASETKSCNIADPCQGVVIH